MAASESAIEPESESESATDTEPESHRVGARTQARLRGARFRRTMSRGSRRPVPSRLAGRTLITFAFVHLYVRGGGSFGERSFSFIELGVLWKLPVPVLHRENRLSR